GVLFSMAHERGVSGGLVVASGWDLLDAILRVEGLRAEDGSATTEDAERLDQLLREARRRDAEARAAARELEAERTIQTTTQPERRSQYRLRDYDHSGTACASISTTSGDPGFYKTPNSVRGTTFNGTDLLFSCWADNTITAIRPVASQTIFAKDTTVGNNGLYTVTGVTGLGGLAWDPAHNVLWACNLSAFTGTNRKLGSDLGYISLNSNGTATFTHFATAPDGCVNGVDYNPTTSVVSASGAKVNDSTKTVDRYVVNSDLTAGALTKFLPGTLTHDGYVSGEEL